MDINIVRCIKYRSKTSNLFVSIRNYPSKSIKLGFVNLFNLANLNNIPELKHSHYSSSVSSSVGLSQLSPSFVKFNSRNRKFPDIHVNGLLWKI